MDATCSVVILDTRHTQKNLVYYFFFNPMLCSVSVCVCVGGWMDMDRNKNNLLQDFGHALAS